MTSRAEDYRAKALQCERIAEKHKGTPLRDQYLELARQWRTMADQAEFLEK